MNTNLIKKYQVHKDDTGSIGVQVIKLTEKINELVKHLKEHEKDEDSRLGLIKLVAKRRKLLDYYLNTNEAQYKKLISDLKLRK